MKTTIDLDDKLFKKLCSYARTDQKGKAIRTAIEFFVQQQATNGLLDLQGNVDIVDYKEIRRLRDRDA